MTQSRITKPTQTLRPVMLLAPLVALSLSACGGGGGGGGGEAPPPPPPPQAVVANARFTEEVVTGLGFSVAGVTEGKVDAAGNFKVAQGSRVDFFVGEGANRLLIGTANPNVASANTLVEFSLYDLNETRAQNGEAYLGNLLRLFAALDGNANFSDGIQIDTAANNAVSLAVAGGKTVSFTQSEDAFATDPVVVATLGTLQRQLVSAEEAFARFTTFFRQSRSSSIALTSDDRRAVVVNRLKNSVSVIRVRNDDGGDSSQLIGEVPVGKEPRFVALSLDDRRAYVTNAMDGTMSVIDLTTAQPQVLGQAVNVGHEPRGIAVTPNGTLAFIANFSTGGVTVVRLATGEVVGTIAVGGNPYSVAVTNDGDDSDSDERVFVTQFYAEQIDPARPVVFDDSKQGVVTAFNVSEAVQGSAALTRLLLKPLASGFNGDRRPFCLQTRQAQQAAGTVFFNSGAAGTGDGAALLKNQTFCPDPSSSDASDTGTIARDPQDVYPNQLYSVLIRGPRLYVPNIGAQPEPPVRFNLNVQGLVGVLDRVNDVEPALSVNLNQQVIRETAPAAGTQSLDRLFMNDIVAIDADRGGSDFLIVSRGGNYIVRAKLGEDGKLTILDANNKALRMQTGNLPSGVVRSRDGKRAYSNNEINTSISALDLETNVVLARDIESSAPPAPGTKAHRVALGELAFFTALGLPDVLDTNGDGAYDIALRDVNPLAHRGKASSSGWSSCGSCHAEGHSDNVTWSFVTGPRQTIPLEGTFARNDLSEPRILNWSAVRSSVTDFNNNARAVQGGTGFASNVNGTDRSTLVFNHGPSKGVSDSLDAMTEWVTTVRAPNVPSVEGKLGADLFQGDCASCHGDEKWTKSSTNAYGNNPTFAVDPIGSNFFAGVPPLDPRVVNRGPQILGVNVPSDAGTVLRKLMDDVGTFNPASPIEIRGGGAVAGQSTQGFASFGGDGFNSPSLLGLSTSAPYFHDGSAATLEDVFARHKVTGGQTIAEKFSPTQLQELLKFVRSIDDRTPIIVE